MISHWDEFEAGPTPSRAERVHITISKKGVILFNRNAYRMLGQPEAAVLLFDKVNSVIGIRPSQPGVHNAFPIIGKGKGLNRVVRAIPFCRHYGIKIDRTVAFPKAALDGEGVMRLDLKATTVADRVNRPNG